MSAFGSYVQARFHGGTIPGGPVFTVVHDAETPLELGYADSIAGFFQRGPTAQTSAHAMVGPEKAIKLLPDNVVAWAAGPVANTRGWHCEQSGYASFTRADWTTTKGLAQLQRMAACFREVHDTWHIPKRWMTDDQLRRAVDGDRTSGGMTTHQQIARVFPASTSHHDPEENYPRDLLLQAVLGTPTPTPAPVLTLEDLLMSVNATQDEWDTVVAAAKESRFGKGGDHPSGVLGDFLIGFRAAVMQGLAAVSASQPLDGKAIADALRPVITDAVQAGMAAGDAGEADAIVDKIVARLAS